MIGRWALRAEIGRVAGWRIEGAELADMSQPFTRKTTEIARRLSTSLSVLGFCFLLVRRQRIGE